MDFYHEGLRFFIFGYPSEYYVEIGEYDRAEDELSEYYKIAREKNLSYDKCLTCIFLGHLHTEKGEIVKAILYMNEARDLIESNMFPPYYITIYYSYYSLLLIQRYMVNQGSLSPKEMKKERKLIGRECRRAIRKTRVWMLNQPVCLRAMALYHALSHDSGNARMYFEKSIDFARKIGRRYEQARSLYEFGVFLRQSGDWNGAWDRLLSAYLLFEEIGVTLFRVRIAEQLGLRTGEGAAAEGPISREKMRYVLEKSREFGVFTDLDALLDSILALAMEVSGARSGYIFLYDDDAERLTRAASRYADDTADGDISMHIVDEAFEKGTMVLAADARTEERFASFQSVSGKGLRSVICLPLKHGEVVTGACYLGNALVDGIFTENTEQLLSMLFSHALVTVENLLLRERIVINESLDKRRTRQEQKYLLGAFSFIYGHLGEDVTRERIADALAIHPNYLGRLFKASTGRTIREYLNEARIMKARELLDEGGRRLIDIAMDAGFESVRTFYRCFYRAFGMTASEYRDRISRQ